MNIKILTSARVLFLFFSASIAIMMTSCNPADSKIKRMESQIDKSENGTTSLSDAEWEKLGKEIEALQSDLDNNRTKYTDEQIRSIGKLQGRYTVISIKRGAQKFKEKIKDAGKQIEGFIEGMKEEVGADDSL
jgi:hypothetical protein